MADGIPNSLTENHSIINHNKHDMSLDAVRVCECARVWKW